MTAPVVSIGNRSMLSNHWQRLQPWISYSDADGNPAVSYQLFDSGTSATSGYFWTPTNAHWAAGTTIDVPASQLSDVWLRSGSASGSETMWVRAFDGIDWSSWASFTFTTTPNGIPIAAISDQSVHLNTYMETGIHPAELLRPQRRCRHQIPVLGQRHVGDQRLFLDSHQHALGRQHDDRSFSCRACQCLVPERLDDRLRDVVGTRFDGSDWGAWDTFTVTSTNATPVATVNDHTLHVGQWAKIDNWTSVVDGDSDTITKYQFWDSGTAATSAYFWTPNNSHWAANTTIEVSAADLANVWIKGGSATGSETLWVRAFDGFEWGAWDTFTLTSTNATPVATVNDHSLHVGQWAKIDSWISVVDGDNDTITKYQFWDSGTAATSAYFWTPTNSHWTANTTIEVSAADLGNVWVQGGTATGSETLWVRAFDGTEWGAGIRSC
ncbi:hypothetical protein JQ620_19685 [Bradyrhizobium sp. AUGA SZCCT0274]|uniref:hypothetical protein n=1 Tax=Bradyrhizobium sp. AUGA SZCCT0274 TaxID=2807670 RepID=UPI001BAC369F|nr:hypothetical protein [Bradyrhizobium sp. AUGA SZCCT0274]MBR1242335.1 hypothetical protein [Bradyrhizobium sp. AUGA SZCCT0274]